ncbi:hypothetical protein D3C79_406200 [compost metagenome]
MLHVEGGVDVYAGAEQLLHILPAFLVAAAGGIGVGQLIHHYDGGLAFEQAIQVHLLQSLLAVVMQLAWLDGELVEQRQGLLAPVGLDHADENVDSFPGLFPYRLQHGVGLAYAGGGAEEDLQLALVFLFQACQQGVGPSLITHSRAPASCLPARHPPVPHHAFLYSCFMPASKAPACTSSRIPVLLFHACQQGTRFYHITHHHPYGATAGSVRQSGSPSNSGQPGAPSCVLVLIEQQIQLEYVDHLGAKDTSLCRRLDLLRQGSGIQPALLGDAIHLGQHGIQGQVGIQART